MGPFVVIAAKPINLQRLAVIAMMTVKAARAWAAFGLASFRFDDVAVLKGALKKISGPDLVGIARFVTRDGGSIAFETPRAYRSFSAAPAALRQILVIVHAAFEIDLLALFYASLFRRAASHALQVLPRLPGPPLFLKSDSDP